MGIAVFTNYLTAQSWTAPAGVTQITASCWGGGQGGDSNTFNGVDYDPGVGGQGGSYARKVLTVVSGSTYTVTVGGPGAQNLGTGGDSWFSGSTIVRAKGGGSAATNIGDVTYVGGSGDFSAGGGGAGSSGSGGNASGNTTGSGTVERGGGGGTAGNTGGFGRVYGGGGGGSSRTIGPGGGGGGAPGLIVLSYPQVQCFEQFVSSSTWVCPPGVTVVTASCWGGGGSGGNADVRGNNSGGRTGGSGGGGAFARKAIAVTPGVSYTVTVGYTIGTGNGGDSWFSSSAAVLAKGGTAGGDATCGLTSCTGGAGGAGGFSGSCIGDVVYSGGDGASGGAGGGGGAGSTGPGGAPSGTTGGTGASLYGGNGGTGGGSNDQPGSPGGLFGGAGGGGGLFFDGVDWLANGGGAGSSGLVILEYSLSGSVVISQNTGAFFFFF